MISRIVCNNSITNLNRLCLFPIKLSEWSNRKEYVFTSSLLYKYFVFILSRYIVLCVDIQCLCYVGIIGMEAAMMILWKQCRYITDIIPIISIIGDTTQISGTLASGASNEDFTITERLDSKRLLALPHLRHY